MKQTAQEQNRIWSLLKSDPEAGVKLAMEQYGGAVKWIAETVLGRDARQDVEECIAETFVRLWRGSASFDPEGGPLYSYTCGIARHVAVDMARRRKKDVSVEDAAESGRGELSEETDFAEQMAAQEDRKAVFEAVDQLPPPDREIFVLRYWMELPVKRIAQLLGLTEKQVENRLYRGRRTLRQTLEDRGITR